MTNLQWSVAIIEKLMGQGVQHFCICPGSRNAPLIEALKLFENAQMDIFFDERAAGFFALGKAKLSKRPVAVVTTSGTAVAELLPSAIEAKYSGWPLVFLTADRPRGYRGSAAPQCIDQSGILKSFVGEVFDGELGQMNWSEGELEQSLHLNLCFADPLLSEPAIDVKKVPLGPKLNHLWSSRSPAEFKPKTLPVCKNPLLLISGLSEWSRPLVKDLLSRWQGLVYVEAPSQMRRYICDSKLVRHSQTLTELAREKELDLVVRLGAVPTCRFWRDLDTDEFADLPVLSFSEQHYSGLGRTLEPAFQWNGDSFAELSKMKFSQASVESAFLRSQQQASQVEELLLQHPLSEPSWVRQFSLQVQATDRLFVGNSLAIREWDEFARIDRCPEHFAVHRGANGIDGQLAGFLGQCAKEVDNWALMGDQTLLYDLSSLAIAKNLEVENIKLAVINNKGGQIFSRLNYDHHYTNPHEFHFAAIADQFGWQYEKTSFDSLDQMSDKKGRWLFELCPSHSETEAFWQALSEVWSHR